MPGRYAAQGAEGDAQPGSRGRVLANRLGIIRVGEMQPAAQLLRPATQLLRLAASPAAPACYGWGVMPRHAWGRAGWRLG